MKKCPECSIPLTRLDYEGFQIFQCSQCSGHLVKTNRLESIKRVPKKSTNELKQIASTDFHGNSTLTIKCPRCRMYMCKQELDIPLIDLQIDICRDCNLAWLDPGELAILQLAYEASAKFIDAQEQKRRIEVLIESPERLAAFQRRLSNAKDSQNYFKEALCEAGYDVFYTLVVGRPISSK